MEIKTVAELAKNNQIDAEDSARQLKDLIWPSCERNLKKSRKQKRSVPR